MMLTPMVASMLTVHFVEHQRIRDSLGIWLTGHNIVNFLVTSLILIGLTSIITIGALVTSSLFGSYDLDIVGMGQFRQVIAQQAADRDEAPPLPMRVLWVLQLLSFALASLINMFPAAGEEIGWRGFLHSRLSVLIGKRRAVMVTSVIWGLWHAPLILLGYNYPSNPLLGLAMMCVFCLGVGSLLAWAYERTGSIWPAAVGHGAINAFVPGTALLFAASNSTVDTVSATLMGWGGWPIILVVVIVVFVSREFRSLRPASTMPVSVWPDTDLGYANP
ncbi:CPBP family intramembrane glutamic endopeptidase [Schaalia vaccimaxillae]|uniref:CPBP family intramembrane glutamic endopeptidase n=1 Tax=Schaalia vaccimaxillae TaxID=183916 RepID=UPI0013F4ACDA|nr:CPBP family intramembrane glutamic endopeptidase [Schaalia vaccimaxillae]